MNQDDVDLTPCYIGRKTCGCVVAVTVDRPEFRRDNIKTVSAWMREGLTIEHTTVAQARTMLSDCVHKSPKKTRGSKHTDAQPSLLKL